MATKSKLFEAWQFQLPLPAPFDDVKAVAKAHSDVGSKYNLAKAAQSTLHGPTLRAILAYRQLMAVDNPGAIGFQGNKLIVAEYGENHHIRLVAFDRHKGKFYAAVTDGPGEPLRAFTLNKGNETGSALLFALMPILLEDEEFSQAYEDFERSYALDDLEALTKAAALLCDNAYRRIMGTSAVLGEAGIDLNLPSTGNITQLTELMLAEETYGPDQILYGQFQVFKPVTADQTVTAGEGSDIAGAFKLSDKAFAEAEQLLIPTLPPWYVLLEEVIESCQHIKESTGFGRPIRNLMFRRDSGVGKTEAAKAMAAGLNIPYYTLTCHPSMEIFDLIGQMLPVDDRLDTLAAEQAKQKEVIVELPKFYDLLMDPATVMCRLTGEEYDETTTADAAVAALVEARSKDNSGKRSGGGQRFHFVKSPLLQALETGALIEIQEPTLINDPGVLAGLNNLLDNGQMITLPTGEVVKRDPNSVVVMTTNVGYAGCKTLNQSLISRLQMIIDMQEPSFEAIVQRALKVSGCADISMVETMTGVFLDMKQHCREKLIQDGSVGIRELIDWVESYMVTKDAYRSALYTIIPSASMDIESRQEFIDVCLTPKIYDKNGSHNDQSDAQT